MENTDAGWKVSGIPATPMHPSAAAGNAVDLAPWGYLWRRDRSVQEKPEAYFIPRRLARQDSIYRTALDALGDDMPSLHYQQPDLLERQLPKPKGELLAGLLWVGGLTDYRVELVWPQDADIPSPEQVEVRTYPTAWGWFGWTVDRRLENPVISQDGRSWQYACPAGLMMDFAYSKRVQAATEMIAVFAGDGCPVPELHVTGGSLGAWKELSFTVEWGFQEGTPLFEGLFETHVAVITDCRMDTEHHRAAVTCLYTPDSRYGADSRITCITDTRSGLGATVLLREVAEKPVCVPEAGLFFCPADAPDTAAAYIARQKAAGMTHVRQRVREHAEETDWEKLLHNARLWRCPDGTQVPPFPTPPSPKVQFHVPDKRWETMYALAAEQLRGPHMWGFLAAEVARATLAMEMLGLHAEADKIYDYFLASPGVKADGDFTDPAGSLEWAKSMRHDMGYNHEGTHFSTGKLLFSMMYHYYLTEDDAWLHERLPRLKQAADWIIKEQNSYMQEAPNREQLHVYGLMPPSMLGDYALPSCDWRWYYCDNAFTQMGLSSFADVLQKIGDAQAAYYAGQAHRCEKDLRSAVKREALYAPVRRSADGMSRSFIPRMAYAGGLLLYGEETNVPQFAMGINDLFQGALPLAEIGGVMDANDRRIVGTLDAMEEAGMGVSVAELERLDHPTADMESKEAEERLAGRSAAERRTSKAPEQEDLWFWNSFSNLPKISHNANVYLRQDDIPNFLHFFFGHAIMMMGSNGKLWEHAHPDVYEPCENPDNGTAAWFAENFRNMLLTEDNGVLWLMKGTPRAWLKQDKQVCVMNAPTWYGDLNYTVTSHMADGMIHAEIQVPGRRTPPVMKLRLRHPDGKRIKSVLCNGQDYAAIDPDGETITFTEPQGRLDIVVLYQ